MHPDGSKFATAGGDGTVRIWNARSLFAVRRVFQQQRKNGSSRFDETTGTFISSSSSSAGDDSSSSEESDAARTNNNNDTNKNEAKPTFQDDASSSSSSSEQAASFAPQVHDLNAVVRRKKGGGVAPVSLLSSPPPPKPTNQATLLSSPVASPSPHSRSKHPGHHHHHQQRLLCTLSAHTGSSVLSVRFSTSGQYLASAGDDACVCIYAPQQQQQHGNLAAASDQVVVEHWARIRLCRGHGLDVVDLAWAPDDSHLVSCSLDSATPIVVWKMADLPHSSNNTHHSRTSSSMIANPFKILGQSLHTSTVKGVAFDPAGSYLASSGDDPAVCIWRAHDDWGLEARVDAATGIFRQWKQSSSNNENAAELSSTQSLFRRISWSTDGAFVCSTNSVVKNKHVASTIAREGWAVSGGASSGSSSSGAANLVGHKQPIVVSRFAPQLLDARHKKKKSKSGKEAEEKDSSGGASHEEESSSEEEAEDDQNEDDEPEHATLLALGDRRGFVTLWSTKKSRPIFKLQCSESRCTVTDLSWGSLGNGDLMLLVSLLDGQIVALRFAVPDELGALLSKKDKARVFQLRYGIDMDDGDGIPGQRRLFVGGGSGPKLIENALQMTLEEDRNEQHDDDDDDAGGEDPFGQDEQPAVNTLVPRSVRDQQEESRSTGGKKRVRPVLMPVGGAEKRQKGPETSESQKQAAAAAEAAAAKDPLQNAMDVAARASAAAESRKESPARKGQGTEEDATGGGGGDGRAAAETGPPPRSSPGRSRPTSLLSGTMVPLVATIPHSTERVHSVDLPLPQGHRVDPLDMTRGTNVFVAECVNVMKVPKGSKGGSIPCVDVSVSQSGRATWKDQIPGTSCSAVAASRSFLAVGTADGSIQIFGSSPTLGWTSGSCFRSHPPLVVGQPVVSLQLKERKETFDTTEDPNLEMLVVAADGFFGVYSLLPELRLVYKGSVMAAMTHMSLGAPSEDRALPKLSRVQITDRGRLFLLLSFDSASPNRLVPGDRAGPRSTLPVDHGGAGGSLQAFVYDRASELWLRVSDSRFVLSDFYSALPSSRTTAKGVLSKMDDAVRLGSLQSSLKASHRGRIGGGGRQADTIYNQGEEDGGNYVASRSHCEDRMACALALQSAPEFKQWLSLYVRTLAIRGNTSQIRMFVDMLLGRTKKDLATSSPAGTEEHIGCWWLSSAPKILNLERSDLVKTIIVPELSKNRSLQRITNEIALEVENI